MPSWRSSAYNWWTCTRMAAPGRSDSVKVGLPTRESCANFLTSPLSRRVSHPSGSPCCHGEGDQDTSTFFGTYSRRRRDQAPFGMADSPSMRFLFNCFLKVLDATEGPVGGHCIHRSRTFHQRTNWVRGCKRRRITYHKIVTTPRAIFYCDPYIVVRLVSCAFRT